MSTVFKTDFEVFGIYVAVLEAFEAKISSISGFGAESSKEVIMTIEKTRHVIFNI